MGLFGCTCRSADDGKLDRKPQNSPLHNQVQPTFIENVEKKETVVTNSNKYSDGFLVTLVDFTLLDDSEGVTISKNCKFFEKSTGFPQQPASFCLYSKFIPGVLNHFETLQHSRPKITTVVNFPLGLSNETLVYRETWMALENGADEIDVVWNFSAYNLGDVESALEPILSTIKAINRFKADKPIVLKVIMETAAITNIFKASNLILHFISKFDLKIDSFFLKTSTGKHSSGGATLDAAKEMLRAIYVFENLKRSPFKIGVKFSGGIRKREECIKYINLLEKDIYWCDKIHPTYLRIGASGLVDDILSKKVEDNQQEWTASVKHNGEACTLGYNHDSVWWKNQSDKVVVLPLNFVFAVTTTNNKNSSNEKLSSLDLSNLNVSNTKFFSIHYIYLTKGTTSKKPAYQVFNFETESEEITLEIIEVLRNKVNSGPGQATIKKILVLINPFGGKKEAVKIYNGIPAKMFSLAGIVTDVDLNIYQYDAIITVSGDGLFHEVVNGILLRDDWEKGRKIPLGMIAGGSASALNTNLETKFPAFAALSIIKGLSTPMDIFSYYSEEKIVYSHLNLTYALIADVDIESEKFRWMGMARTTIGALVRILRLREYKGTVYFKPVEGENIPLEARNTSKNKLNGDEEIKHLTPTVYPTHNGPRLESLLEDYRQFDGCLENYNFTSFQLSNLSWIAPDFMASPHVKFNSGTMDFIYSGSDLTKMSITNAFLDGTKAEYLKNPMFKHCLVKSLVLIPKGLVVSKNSDGSDNLDSTKGIFSLSGEAFKVAPVRLEIHPAVMKVLTPQHLNEDLWLQLFNNSKL
ncbi:hypothetical protein HK099_008446 [Clydaea vesicula]|uniref:DAGKc domain-containing protein n=1 Tax=Clydaea vesicula TaxID=447962 RepID=A0AAD5TVC2_9FUNG|nr:hypothetical protein HK099_008446 [Clydaea vesicula]